MLLLFNYTQHTTFFVLVFLLSWLRCGFGPVVFCILLVLFLLPGLICSLDGRFSWSNRDRVGLSGRRFRSRLGTLLLQQTKQEEMNRQNVISSKIVFIQLKLLRLLSSIWIDTHLCEGIQEVPNGLFLVEFLHVLPLLWHRHSSFKERINW